MGYVKPADVGVSDNRAAHVARGSKEPGTDYKTAMNTDLRAPEAGKVILVDHSPGGAEGRRFSMLLDDGNVVDWIHGARILAKVGDTFDRGEKGLFLSGASGFGVERHYGPHVHVTLRDRLGLPYSQTLDFEKYVGTAAPANNGGFSKKATKGIQQALNTMGYGLYVDSVYGENTRNAVKAFQKSQGLTPDGIWGPNTNGAYNRIVVSRRPLIRQGSKGNYVKLLQKKLGIKQDSVFGPDTRKHVIAYQLKNKLYPDGIVGKATWQKLGY